MSEAAQLCRRCIKNSMAKRLTSISAAPIPDKLTLPALRAAATGCKACDLWKLGTQTVFGEGRLAARVMMVGEQPGDKEDLQGRPFVGPAGAVLDKALAAAGIDRKDVYVTNIVKHFKWEPRGKRRLHKKPNALEISACRPWLEAEIKVVKPEVVVLLGATAAQGMLGNQFRVTNLRGQWVQSNIAPLVMATVHPSSILRAPDDDSRHEEMRKFVADLRRVATQINALRAA
jgi:uracil-DNA glycosylase family protein